MNDDGNEPKQAPIAADWNVFAGYVLCYFLLLAILSGMYFLGTFQPGLLLCCVLTVGLTVIISERIFMETTVQNLWFVGTIPYLVFLMLYMMWPGYISPFVTNHPTVFLRTMVWALVGVIILHTVKSKLWRIFALVACVLPTVLLVLLWPLILPIPGGY